MAIIENNVWENIWEDVWEDVWQRDEETIIPIFARIWRIDKDSDIYEFKNREPLILRIKDM